MNRAKSLAATAAIAATILTAAPVLAVRSVEMGPACGTAIIFNATENWGIRFYSTTASAPDRHIVFQASGNLTIRIAPGGWAYQFHAPNGNTKRSGSFVVGC